MTTPDTPTLTPEEEAGWRRLASQVGSALLSGRALSVFFATIDASRARVRELEAGLVEATADRERLLFDASQKSALAAEMAEALAALDRDARPANWNDGDDGPLEAAWRRGDAALARYRAQAGGDGWLPIESAPHGVEVLLYTPPFACMGASARHEMRVGCASWGDVVNGISNRGYDGHGTHWRPLPPPPASEQEGR